MQEIGIKNKLDDHMIIKDSNMKQVIKPTKPHKHEGYHELIFLSQGSGFHQIDMEKIDVHPPVGFYLRPGQVHCWDFSKIPGGYVILFKEEALNGFWTTKNSLMNVPALFLLEKNQPFFDLVEQFYQQYKTGETIEILSAFLNVLVLKILSVGNDQPPSLPSELSDFYAFKSLVEENFLQVKQVTHYAEMLKFSTYRLNAICRSVANKNASEIIKERVLMEAKNQITHTTLSLAEVAYRLNFTDPSNFIKFFKARTTLTPSEYREKAMNQ